MKIQILPFCNSIVHNKLYVAAVGEMQVLAVFKKYMLLNILVVSWVFIHLWSLFSPCQSCSGFCRMSGLGHYKTF